MKKAAKAIIVFILAWQVRRLRKNNEFRIIGIAGSIGKTSTKFAIAAVLGQKYKVRFQEGNYNDLVSVPLVFFGQSLPVLFNPFAWIIVLIKNEAMIRKPYPFDIVLLELGTDGPGQIKEFEKYLGLDIGVLTAITPEHMQAFKDLDNVAAEELEIAKFSKKVFINVELCDKRYLKKIANYIPYDSKEATLTINEKKKIVSKAQLFSMSAAIIIGRELGIGRQGLIEGIKSIKPVNGRMNLLNGIKDSQIIDDTYNSSPKAVKEALDTLYQYESSQRIAVLGSMNELGEFSAAAHQQIGEYCDPKFLDLVITIGEEANDYLAAAAEKRGCEVAKFSNPYEAGEYLKDNIRPNAVVLAKGSQNGVFAEEAIKYILKSSADKSRLVRQSPDWLKIKNKQFAMKDKI